MGVLYRVIRDMINRDKAEAVDFNIDKHSLCLEEVEPYIIDHSVLQNVRELNEKQQRALTSVAADYCNTYGQNPKAAIEGYKSLSDAFRANASDTQAAPDAPAHTQDAPSADTNVNTPPTIPIHPAGQ